MDLVITRPIVEGYVRVVCWPNHGNASRWSRPFTRTAKRRVLAVYAVRRRYPVLGVLLGVLAVAVFDVLGVAAGFVAIVLLLLGGAMDELSAGPLGIIAGRLCSLG